MKLNLRHVRSNVGLLQNEAEEKLGIAHSTMCRYENGDRIPKDYILWNMINLYKMTPEQLGEVIINKLKMKNFNKNKINEIKERVENE
ncbi:helix-turn-helix domain-containing protein [Clostridium thermobutyricum]|uniref:helix-turn-helix domain-containing protein n=1 Tax=Clostridium thermobutyricum TaxID=29372 RepID=UPI0018A9220E|nr:helix-turn-helix transcriptional regulator [Clostridium thermobutyricum]